MPKYLKSFALVATASALLFTSQATVASEFSDEEKANIEQIVHDYLVKNPQVLVEALQSLESQQAQEAAKVLDSAIEFFLNEPNIPSRGAKDYKHYMIEFFDYNCGYCKQVRPLTREFATKHGVRTFYVELPILNEHSVKASAIGLALFKKDPEMYFKYQDILMSSKERLDSSDKIKAAVEQVGGSYAELEQEAKANLEVQNALRKNLQVAREIGLQGTPFFIIDGNVIRGAVRNMSALEQALRK